jgi:hypothetical protein
MYVTIEQVKIGAMNFMDREIASKAVGAQKFFTYMAMPIIGKKIENYAVSFSQSPATADFFNENGSVNIDEIYNMAKTAVQKSGQFSVYGVILGETDIDKIYNYIKSTTA